MKQKFKNNILIFTSFILVSIAINMLAFHKPDWDFLSYHYYNGWAFWHDRLNTDFMPCLFRTYFNPILDGILYLILDKLNNYSMFLILLIGTKYAILMFLAYKLYDFLFKENGKEKLLAILFCLVLAGASPIILHCNTIDNTDTYGAIMILLGLIFVLKYLFATDSKKRNWIIFSALTLCGMAVGLKYTNMPCVAGIFVSAILFTKKIDKPIKTFLVMFTGATFGFLLTDAYWLYLLWTKFQNPFFPYFNEIFKSPMADTNSVLTTDFAHLKPSSVIEFLLWPFQNTNSSINFGIESRFFDLKMILGFISIILISCTAKTKVFVERTQQIINTDLLYFLVFYVIFSYYINLAVFGNVRYIIVIFLILPIMIYTIIRQLSNSKIYKYALLTVLLLFFTTYKPTQNHIGILYNSQVPLVQIENVQIENDATVLCSSFSASSIAPKQNPNVKYIGFVLPKDLIKKGFYNLAELHFKNRYYSNTYLEKVLSEIIPESENLYIVIGESSLGTKYADLELYEEALSRYSNGKIQKITNCKEVKYTILENSNPHGEIKLCKLK